DIGAGLPPTKTHYFLHRDIRIQFEEYLKTLGLEAEDVLRLEPASAVLTALTDGVKWGFVDNATSYVFNLNNVNEEFLSFLKALFLAPTVGLKTGLHFRGPSPQTIQSVLEVKFNVVVQ